MVTNDQPVLISKKSRDAEDNTLSMDAVRQLEQATLFCLTLASENAAPVFMAKTSWFDHPAHSYHGLTGGGGGTSPGEQQPSRYDEFDADLVGELFKSVDRLEEKDQTSLFLAVERLRKSRLHEEPVNRAIDLGVALEIIFLHKIDNNQELSFRAGIRAAFLLGADKEERCSISEVVRNAYGARSKAVHTGQLNKEKHIDSLPQADELCRKAAIKLVTNGGFPEEWESLIFAD